MRHGFCPLLVFLHVHLPDNAVRAVLYFSIGENLLHRTSQLTDVG